MIHTLGAALGVVLLIVSAPLAAQCAAALPRTTAGTPDLSGIWQSTAIPSYDIEPHDARPTMAMRAGPVVSVPAKEVAAPGAVRGVRGGAGAMREVYSDATWFDRSGNHHRETMTVTVTKRFTMSDPDHIRYQATITDPRTLSRPWTMPFTPYRNMESDARLGQFRSPLWRS